MKREQLQPTKAAKPTPKIPVTQLSEPDPLTPEACNEIIAAAMARGIPREAVVQKLRELSGLELE
jgi:hypothetical protein